MKLVCFHFPVEGLQGKNACSIRDCDSIENIFRHPRNVARSPRLCLVIYDMSVVLGIRNYCATAIVGLAVSVSLCLCFGFD